MNQDEYKIRNLESQILYLQQEHSNTLKLLHNEIKDLQMKNSETSLQLAMLNITSKDGDIEKAKTESDCLIAQISDLKSEIEDLNAQLNTKVSQLQNYDAQINRLTETITKLKEQHNTEIAAMEKELENKSADIVHLSTKLLKRLDQSKSVSFTPGDHETVSSKDLFIAQPPIAPKTFKFRNQISVHPDNIHLRRRPIIARQTVVSTSVPIKSMVSQPAFPEYAISVEDRAVFSKSIKRPSVLPPIQLSRTHTPSNLQNQSTIIGQDSATETKYFDVEASNTQTGSTTNLVPDTNFSHSPNQSKTVHVNVERLLDVNTSSHHQSSSQTTIPWNVPKKSHS